MCSLLMRLQRSTSLFNFGCFAASWQHAEVNQKALIAAAIQNVKWELRMKGLPMNRVFRTRSSSWPRATLSARVRQLRNAACWIAYMTLRFTADVFPRFSSISNSIC